MDLCKFFKPAYLTGWYALKPKQVSVISCFTVTR